MPISLGVGSLLGGLGSGLLSGIGGYIGGTQAANTSAAAARWATEQQLKWEREKFDREIELSNTAIQRRVNDLEKAGLNKIFATSEGANTPTAGSITPSMPDTSGIATAYQGLGDIFKNSINSAANLYQQGKQIKNIEADTRYKNALTIVEMARKGLISAQEAKELGLANLTNISASLLDKYGDLTSIAKIAGGIGLAVWGLTPAGKMTKKGYEVLKSGYEGIKKIKDTKTNSATKAKDFNPEQKTIELKGDWKNLDKYRGEDVNPHYHSKSNYRVNGKL